MAELRGIRSNPLGLGILHIVRALEAPWHRVTWMTGGASGIRAARRVGTFLTLSAAMSTSALANEESIRLLCADEWGENREMYAFCVREQRGAAKEISRHQGEIRERCEQEWGYNFQMVLHCIREQRASQDSVSRAPQDEIASRCAREWRDNFVMQEHCAKERRAAKESVESSPPGAKRSRCEREWGTQYEMVEYCLRDQ